MRKVYLVNSDTTYHKTLLNQGIGAHMRVAMATIFCQILVAMATVSGHLTFFRDKIIKFQYYNLLSSKFQKHWEKFTLVNNSLVWHQLLVLHV